MPRACKRGRKSQAESGASSGRGRKTRASAMADLMQSSSAYGAPDHNATAAYARTKIPATPNLPERPNSRYNTRAQTKERMNPYVRLKRLDIRHYNTRSGVHNLSTAAAPTMERYWGSSTSTRAPVSVNSGPVQQMNNKSPVACPLPPQTKDQAIQPEFTLTDEEVTLLKTLRSKLIDTARINLIVENNNYIVVYNEDTREHREINNNMPAIEYNNPPTNISVSDTESSPNSETTETPALQDFPNQMQVTPEEATPR